MPRRRLLLLFLLAGALAAAGWWFVRGPAVERRAVAPPPDIDIDPPAMRARREAAIALAKMPAVDPWTWAESLAASGAASGVPAEKEQCGIEDGPQFAPSDSTEEAGAQTRGASPRFVAAQARIDGALRASGDPLDRAVADLLNVGGMRSEAGATEAVVQQAAASSDPRLYALGYGLCHSAREPAPGCRAITVQRWAEVDPGNGMPWVDLLAQAKQRGDAAGVRAAMGRLGAATHFDGYLAAPAGSVVAHPPADLRDVAALNDLAQRANAIAETMPIAPFQPLIDLCRNHAGGDERLAQSCRAIDDTMFEHSDTMIVRALSGTLQQQMTGDAARRDIVRAERAVLQAHWSPATGFSPCRTMREGMKKLLRMSQVGEVEAMREESRKFVTP